MKKKAVIMLSGGPDSTIALAKCKDDYNVKAITFDFGQQSAPYEIAASRRIANHYDVPLEVIDLHNIKNNFLGLSEGVTIGLGFRSAAGHHMGNCPHALFGIATSYALMSQCPNLILGIHKGDYPENDDARTYLKQYGQGVKLLHEVDFNFVAPFYDMTKGEVFAIGQNLKVPFNLTRSCSQETKNHCGKCDECKKRKEAFKKSNLNDMTTYDNE